MFLEMRLAHQGKVFTAVVFLPGLSKLRLLAKEHHVLLRASKVQEVNWFLALF